MIQKVLSGIGGIGLYGIISLVLFFAIFLGVVIWASRLGRPYLDRMSHLPLNDGTDRDAREAASNSLDTDHE